ncbi:YnbE family lipoprotein [Rhodospirillum sp. A1_3_36]|uniref:YnbE family lipoprotein n=1 Tax=Rhodospirillum sp. A1_3_36 TaxID=3391666 RepID=UPI0039A47DF5
MMKGPKFTGAPVAFAVPVFLVLGLGACQPTVKVEAPDKPIRIDLNVNIQQDVRIRLEKSVEDLHQQNPNIF